MSNAASPRRGLGRGFEVLIGGASSVELAHVPIEQIHANPRQPRRRFDHSSTAGLADSIRTQGVVQPVVLRPRLEGGYELIAGERRWRASREAGLPTVPALIREADDRDTLLLGLVENVARENLSPIEEARGYAVLIDEFELSLGEVSRAGRPLEAGDLEQAAAPRALRRRARDGRARRALRGSCAGGPRRSRPRRAAAVRAEDRGAGDVRARRRARCPLVGREDEAADEDAGRSRARARVSGRDSDG